jgi:hypothetical protein
VVRWRWFYSFLQVRILPCQHNIGCLFRIRPFLGRGIVFWVLDSMRGHQCGYQVRGIHAMFSKCLDHTLFYISAMVSISLTIPLQLHMLIQPSHDFQHPDMRILHHWHLGLALSLPFDLRSLPSPPCILHHPPSNQLT